MTIPGFTDQELADLARKKGASEESVRKWLASMARNSTLGVEVTRTAGTSGVAEMASVLRGIEDIKAGRWTALKPDRGRTAPKRASTPRRSEASVQREIIQALTNAGWRTWRIGQYNARRTQDAGVPDVYATLDSPTKLRPISRARLFCAESMGNLGGGVRISPRERTAWIEVKRPHGGRQSEAQREFQRQCEHAGVRYILAKSVDDIRELL